MDSGNSIRVPHRVSLNPPPKRPPNSTLNGPGEITSPFQGDRGIGGEESSVPSPRHKRKFHQPDVPSSKRGRLMETCHQLTGLEQACGATTFQDGRDQSIEGLNPERRSYGETGPKGRIPLSPDVPSSPTISQISMEQTGVGIQKPSLRIEQCSLCLYQTDEASCGHAEEAGDKMLAVPGRHADLGPSPSKPSCSPIHCNRIASVSGVYYQHQKECFQPVTSNRVPGLPDKFPEDDNRPSRSEDPSSPEDDKRVYGGAEDNSEEFGKTPRSHGGSAPSSSSSTPLLQKPSAREDQGNTPSGLQFRDLSDYADEDRIELVVGSPEATQWPQSSNITLGLGSRVGRFNQRLGCQLPGSQHRRPMDKGRKREPHQLSGATSSLASHTVIRIESEFDSYPPPNGQYHGDSICEQDGRNPLLTLVKPGSQDLEMVPLQVYHHPCGTSPRQGECEGRLGISPLQRFKRLETTQGGVRNT